MPRDFRAYLEDVLEAAAKIRDYTAGLTLETFRKDPRTIDAVVRNLEIIGEAIKNVPEQVRLQHPEVTWRRVAGLRDLLIHQYFGIDYEIIWDLVRSKLPVLEGQVRSILQEDGPRSPN
jgi:uncharacterized protein with HEPN domain